MSKHERNAICDVCGFEYKHYELRQRWDGLMVCRSDWEPRHPQDLQKIPRTEKAPPWTRPPPADVEVEVSYISTSVGTQETTIPSGTFSNEL